MVSLNAVAFHSVEYLCIPLYTLENEFVYVLPLVQKWPCPIIFIIVHINFVLTGHYFLHL